MSPFAAGVGAVAIVVIAMAASQTGAAEVTSEDIKRCDDAVKAVRRESGFTLTSHDVKGLYAVARPDPADRDSFSAQLFSDLLSRVADTSGSQFTYEVTVEAVTQQMLWRPKDRLGRVIGPSRALGSAEYVLALADLRAHLPEYCDLLTIRSMRQSRVRDWGPETVRALIEKGPTSPTLYFELAMIYQAAGDAGQTTRWFERAKSASRDVTALYEGVATFADEAQAVDAVRAMFLFPPERLVIAASVSQTGRLAAAGKALSEGYLWWKEDVNRRGGILGRQIEVKLADDQSDQGNVEKTYTGFVRADKVSLVLGPFSTAFTVVAARAADTHAYPLVASVASPGGLLKAGLKNVFAVLPFEGAYWDPVIATAGQRGATKYALLYADSVFYADIAAQGAEYVKRRGGEVVQFDKFPTGTSDFGPYLDKFRRVRGSAPVVIGEPPAVALFLRQAKEKGASLENTFAITYPSLDPVVGGFPLPALATSTWEPFPGLPNPGIADFVRAYQEMWGRPPNQVAAAAAGAAQVLEAAIRLAGSFERGRVADALRKLETRTILGDYRYDAKVLQAAGHPLLIRWSEAGRKTILWPKEVVGE